MAPIILRKGTPEYAKILKRLHAGEEPRDIARTTCFTSAMIGAVKAHITMRARDRQAGFKKGSDHTSPKIRAKAIKMVQNGYSTKEIVRKLQIPMCVVSAIRAHATRGHYNTSATHSQQRKLDLKLKERITKMLNSGYSITSDEVVGVLDRHIAQLKKETLKR